MCDRIELLKKIEELEKVNKSLNDRLECAETNFLICNDNLKALGDLVGGTCYDQTYSLVKELVDKATPKKVIKLPKTKYGYMHICPICNNYIGTIVYDTSARIIVEIEHDDYCCSCGQALDWSDEDA